MADILLFPNISFDESDVGPRPVTAIPGNRIGVVGEFNRGPNNQFILVDTPDSLVRLLGKDASRGSVAIQTAMDQGARDFGVRRVMGRGVSDGSSVRFLLEGPAAGSGRVVLFSTAAIVPVLGNGATSKENVAKLLAAGIQRSGVANLSATAQANVVNVQTVFDGLPVMFRFVDPENPRNIVDSTGIVLKNTSGQVIQPDTLVRLSGSTLDVQVEYDQSSIKSELEISLPGSPANGDNFVVQIGAQTQQIEYRNASAPNTSTKLGITTQLSVDETLRVTIGTQQFNHKKTANQTNADIVAAIVASVNAAAPGFLTYLNVTAGSGSDAGKLLISSKLNMPFDSISVSATVLPASAGAAVVGVAAWENNVVQLLPVITTAAGAAANLAAKFIAIPGLAVTANSNKLIVTVANDANLNPPVQLDALGDFSGDWTVDVLRSPAGVAKTVDVHVLVGAETLVTQGISLASTIVSELTANISDRRLSVVPTIDSDGITVHLESRFDASLLGDRVRRYPLIAVAQYVNGIPAVIGYGTANALAVQQRPAVAGTNFAALDNATCVAMGGGLRGPVKGSCTFRRNQFVRAVATGSLAAGSGSNNGKAVLTLSGGEVTIGAQAKLELADLTCVMNVGQPESGVAQSLVVAEYSNGAVKLSTVNTPAANQVVIGKYVLTGNYDANNNLGVFDTAEVGLAVNGDILRVEASSEGVWANNLSVTVSPGAADFIIITARYLQPDNVNYVFEEFNVQLKDAASLNNAVPYPELLATANSSLIKVFYVGGTEEGKLAKLYNETQVVGGGFDGPPPNAQDYINVIQAMAIDPVNILIASGNTHPDVRRALINQAEASDEISGLRIAVLTADRRLSPSMAANLTQGLDSAHAVMVGGWVTYAGRTDLAPKSVPPDGFYAGHLAATSRIEVSPAARTSSPSFKNIKEVDIPSPGTQAYNAYTKARVEMIIFDQVTGVFHCLNGRSLSVDSAWQWVAIRRVYNYIRANIFQNLQFAKSEPNNAALQRQVAGAVDQFLFLMKTNQQILDYQPTKVDSENNPPNLVAQGMLRVDMFFSPVYPADFITVGLHRVIPVSLTVQTGQ